MTATETPAAQLPAKAAPQQIIVTKDQPPLEFLDLVGEANKTAWSVMCRSHYPGMSYDSVLTVAKLCHQRGLDLMAKPYHIVKIGDTESIWPSINLYRCIAHRTAQYCGQDEALYGPEKDFLYQGRTYRAPEWCKVTVYRWNALTGKKEPYTGKIFYEEQVVLKDKGTVPNDMWAKRPKGQMEKGAEALALRKAFPEEIGSDPTFEEMEGRSEVELGFKSPYEAMQERVAERAQVQQENRETILAEFKTIEPTGEAEKIYVSAEKRLEEQITNKLEAEASVMAEKGDRVGAEAVRKEAEQVKAATSEKKINIAELTLTGSARKGWKSDQVKSLVKQECGLDWADAVKGITREQFDAVLLIVSNKTPAEALKS